MSDTSYGFIGLGNMGHPMASNLAAAGFEVAAFDKAGTEERLPEGAVAAAGVAEMAAAVDTIFLSLPDGPVVRGVLAEILGASRRTTDTVIDLSTVGVEAAQAAATQCAADGVVYVDCPVSGGQVGAKAATIAAMWAGPARLLEIHRPALAAIAKNIFHVGDTAGMGQTVKLLNNFLSATTMAATSEAVHFGISQGLAMKTILDVVNVSSGRSYGSMDKFPRHVESGSFDSYFDLALMAKDLTLYEQSLMGAGTHSEIGHLIAALWRRADHARPGADHTEIFKALDVGAGS